MLALSLVVCGESLLRSALVGVLRKGLFSCDGKAAAADFFGICLVEFLAKHFLEPLCIKACAENGRDLVPLCRALSFRT